jgi:hypothetical protein
MSKRKPATTAGEFAKIVAYPVYDEIPVDVLGKSWEVSLG